MNPSRRLAFALGALALVTATGWVGYILVVGFGPLDALYMTVITLSTVGYREVGHLGPAGRLFTMALIVFGVGTTFYTLVALAEFLIEGRVRDLLGRRSMKRAIGSMQDHVVLCGYGRFGRVVAQELARSGIDYVVVESELRLAPELEASGRPFVLGSALDDAVLAEAGVARARAIVIATPSDADNVFIALSAREASPQIAIHARGESEAGIRRLRLAGAMQVISPYHLGGQRIAHAIARPAVVDFIELAAPGGGSQINLEEVRLGAGCKLANARLGALPELGVRVSVVAIKREGATTRLDPGADDVLQAGDRVVVVGDQESLRRLAELALPH